MVTFWVKVICLLILSKKAYCLVFLSSTFKMLLMSTVCPLCKSLILLASASVAILEEQKDSHHTLNENYVLKSRLFNGTPLSFAETPTGYPIKNSHNRKIQSNG